MSTGIALLSDIHGNAAALRAVLADIQQHECRQIFVLGDIINGIDPAQCVELLMAQPQLSALKGNAEWYALTPDLDAFPLRDDPRYAEVVHLSQWWAAQLSSQQLAWITALPDMILEGSMALVHDSPLDRLDPERRAIAGVEQKYHDFCFHAPGIWATTSESDARPIWEWMEETQVTELFCGHTHEPFHWVLGQSQLCNTGSVGMPLDGDPRSSWVQITNTHASQRQIAIHRVAYPIEETVAQVELMEYPGFERPGRRRAYQQMLRTGKHWRMHMPSDSRRS